jgi:hypothetical protein
MEKKEHRRKSKRFPVSWEATVIFDKSNGTLVVHARTQDISSGGASIVSEYGDLAQSLVTLVLSQPPLRGSDKSRTFKVRSRIVSTMRGLTPPGYRHGLNFLRAPGDGLEFLEELLAAVAAAEQGEAEGAPSAATPAAVAAASPAGGSRLAQLKQLAQAKLAEEKKPDSQEEKLARVSDALQRAYQYFKELAEQLNVVKPAFAKGYAIVGVPEFSHLAWESGRVDLRTRDAAPGKKIFEQVSLFFRISGNKQLRVSRESPASERLRQLLTDNKIEFKAHEDRNQRGRTVFEFACEVKASVVLEANPETGRILLKTRNVERFGMLEHKLLPDAVTAEALEEFAGFILGETNRVGPLLLKGL